MRAAVFDEYSFCLDDGALLVAMDGGSSNLPTRVLTSGQPSPTRGPQWPMAVIAVLLLVIAGLAVAYLMRGRDDNAGDKFKTAGALPEQITNSNSENAPDSTPPTRPRPDQ